MSTFKMDFYFAIILSYLTLWMFKLVIEQHEVMGVLSSTFNPSDNLTHEHFDPVTFY
jgi:hypothetical protein